MPNRLNDCTLSDDDYWRQIKTQIAYFQPLIAKYIKDECAMQLALKVIEASSHKVQLFYCLYDLILSGIFANCILLFLTLIIIFMKTIVWVFVRFGNYFFGNQYFLFVSVGLLLQYCRLLQRGSNAPLALRYRYFL